jgi:hypothetical protein
LRYRSTLGFPVPFRGGTEGRSEACPLGGGCRTKKHDFADRAGRTEQTGRQ